MHSSRLWQVFEKRELNDLREITKRVNSSAFHQRKNVSELVDYVLECRRELKIIPDYESQVAYILLLIAISPTLFGLYKPLINIPF